MSAVCPRVHGAAPSSWARHAVLHVHCMSPWWVQVRARPDSRRVRHRGNVALLPAPVAGYRIRHDGADAVVEIKPRSASAIEIARCPSIDDARQLLSTLEHVRPYLGEIGRAA